MPQTSWTRHALRWRAVLCIAGYSQHSWQLPLGPAALNPPHLRQPNTSPDIAKCALRERVAWDGGALLWVKRCCVLKFKTGSLQERTPKESSRQWPQSKQNSSPGTVVTGGSWPEPLQCSDQSQLWGVHVMNRTISPLSRKIIALLWMQPAFTTSSLCT